MASVCFAQPDQMPPYLVFLAHAGSDKYQTAYTLLNKFAAKGVSSFLDEKMRYGSRPRISMQKAVEGARVGITVLSPDFVASSACMAELKVFLKQDTFLIPIFLTITVDDSKAIGQAIIAHSTDPRCVRSSCFDSPSRSHASRTGGSCSWAQACKLWDRLPVSERAKRAKLLAKVHRLSTGVRCNEPQPHDRELTKAVDAACDKLCELQLWPTLSFRKVQPLHVASSNVAHMQQLSGMSKYQRRLRPHLLLICLLCVLQRMHAYVKIECSVTCAWLDQD